MKGLMPRIFMTAVKVEVVIGVSRSYLPK